jgi:hypothetical protein
MTITCIVTRWTARSLLSLMLVLSGWNTIAASEPNRDQVALLVNQSAFESLSAQIKTYQQDVEARFPVRIHVVRGAWKSPDEVRSEIKALYGKKNISGAILVGAIPMHRFFMHGFPNPNPLYYEDFEMTFVDRNKDGISDGYTGKANPKLWVANMRCEVDGRNEGIDGLIAFFAKTHDYYLGKQKIEQRALAISGSDWPGGGNWFADNVGKKLLGNNDVDVLEGKNVTLTNMRTAINAHAYTMCYIQVHSSWTQQGFEDGNLNPSEISAFKTGALFTVNHGCSTANWARNEAEGNGPNTAMSWVFGKGIGQAVVAGVRTGMVYGQNRMYESLLAGNYVGKAYLETKRAAEEEMSHGDKDPGDIFAGVLFIGNPFLTIKPIASSVK